jgi:hypothetical protein
MFFTQIDYGNLEELVSANTIKWIDDISDYTFNFLAYFVGLKFLILLVHILIDIYDMLIHDMNLQQHQKNEE